ncbi:myocardial zonula adherens protein-like [Polyodon spathula]|uniref:myocardial zonula adherens protein-like n=1 Tax=Polyodon spathula TaxID=7913 RepID=UPI001B7E1072|nr:myocardial zonula adherens protein-like [Polyodon spathula]
MIRYSSASGTTVTTTDSLDQARRRAVRTMRLTLQTHDSSPVKDGATKKGKADNEEKPVTPTRRRKNGHVHSERTTIIEKPALHLSSVSNGAPSEPNKRGMVYGVVHRPDADSQREVVVCEWSANQMKDEMNYIKEVRVSLEKVRERMYGEFGGIQQKMQQLSQDIRVANSQRQSLQSELKVKTAALESYDQMSSSLTSVTIDLQKSLLDSSLERNDMRQEMKSLKESYDNAVEKLKEKERQLEAAQGENKTLKLKVESSQEANSQVLQDMTRKLYNEYEDKLGEEQRMHRRELEALQAQANEYIRQIQEANEKVRLAEEKINEKDQRIGELDRLILCMGEEQSQLQRRLQENEQQRERLRQTDEIDGSEKSRRSQLLEEEASSLRERIKHLDDLVHNQQRKVKQMIGEIENLKRQIEQKDMCIEQLLERVSVVDCENKELQDKLNYLMSLNNTPRGHVETRETGVECNLPYRRFVQTLPDKGKRISDFVEKVRSALAHIEDVERTDAMLSTAKMEFESRFQPRSTIMEKECGHNTEDISTSQTQLLKTFINSNNAKSKYTKENGYTMATAETISECIDVHMPQNNCDTPADSLARVSVETATTALLGQPVYDVKINSALKNDEELAQVFEKVTLADETEVMAGLGDTRQETVSIGDNRQNSNPFGINQPQKKPHYIEVFEKAEKNPAVRKSKFKPNQLPSGSHGSSSAGSSSPSHSPRRPESQLSPAERLLRDKKHLDDITAARLPPLHHLPTQLLSMEESAALQQGQKKKYEEVQAKVAAQKLAEKLNVRMVPFNPEGEAMVKYREVHDDGDIHSSEDD